MLKLYDYLPSGNGYKVRLLLQYLQIPFELETYDIWNGATRTGAFLKKNPNGKIPVLRLEDGRYLWESHAIIWYLAQGSSLIPADPFAKAQVMQWMCFEQYELEPSIGVIRARIGLKKHQTPDPDWEPLHTKLRQRGAQALTLLDQVLARKTFLVNDCYSLADLAVYGYVHVAHEAFFDMQQFPHIQHWMQRISQQPNYVPITWRP